MESYILFWLVYEWAFSGLKIDIMCLRILLYCGMLFLVLVCCVLFVFIMGMPVFFMGSLSCLCVYLGSYDYLFLLIPLFLWYELPIYIIYMLI